MKKFTFVAAGCLLLSGMAYGQPAERRGVNPSESMTINGQTFRVGNPASKSVNTAVRTHKRPVVGPNVITKEDLPETAVRQEYSKTSGGYYFYGANRAYQDAAQAAQIYWDGNDAYLWNVLSYKETDSFVKGKRSGNVLTVPMGQYVDEEDDFGIKLGLFQTVLTVDDNPDFDPDFDNPDKAKITYIYFEYAPGYESVNYNISSNGTLELVMPELKGGYIPPDDGYEHPDPADYDIPYFCMGFFYTDDDTWTGDGDLFQTYYEFNYAPVVVPEGIEFNYFSYINAYDQGVLVQVGRVDNDFYFKGLSAFAPDAVFKGTLNAEGTRISIPQNQFIGMSEDGYYNLLTKTVITDRFGKTKLADPSAEAYFMVNYDDNGNIVSFEGDDSNNILEFNYADDYYDPYDEFPGVKLKYQKDLSGTPRPPRQPYFEDHVEWLGAFWLFFFFDMDSTEGNILDVNNLYYKIYVNGEPYTFEQKDGENLKGDFITMYQFVTEPTDLIGYTFYNGNDLFYDEYHLYYVGFYDVTGFETVGVQTVYKYGDTETCSEIKTVDVRKVVGIDSVNAEEEGTPVYYDLQGRRIQNPGHGLYIKVVGGKASKVIL